MDEIKFGEKIFYNLGNNISGSSEYGGNTLNNIAQGKNWATCYLQLINYYRIIKEIKNKNQIILDAGCGQAELLDIMRGNRLGNKYIGIELNDKNIKESKHKFKKSDREILIKYDLTLGIPLEDKIADIVVCSLVLEHMTKKQAFKLFEELLRVTKINGKIMVLVPIRKEGEDNEKEGHVYEWHKSDISELLNKYKNITCEDCYFAGVKITDIRKSKYDYLYKLLRGKIHPIFIRMVLAPLLETGRDIFIKVRKENDEYIKFF